MTHRTHRTRRLAGAALVACAAAALAAAPSHAAPLTNGSFELPGFDGAITMLRGGDTTIAGWTATSPGFDWRKNPNLAPDGSYLLDLNRAGGGIEQTFTTVPGVEYDVRFETRDRPGCGDRGTRLVVSADRRETRYIAQFGIWTTYPFFFTADADGSTTLRFAAEPQNRLECSPLLDDVEVRGPAADTLDARAASRAVKPQYTSERLATGGTYKVTVQGTSSSWDRTIMAPDGQRARNWVVCGAPEDAPRFSGGDTDGRVGEDPAFLFALPQTGTRCNPKFRTLLPYKQSPLEFSRDGGTTWSPAPRPDGDPVAPTADHRYEYTLAGNGLPLRIRFADRSPADNSGRYLITVEDLTPA